MSSRMIAHDTKPTYSAGIKRQSLATSSAPQLLDLGEYY
jgi:hypothetical protein